MSNSSGAKFPEVDGISLHKMRAILKRKAEAQRDYLLGIAIEETKLPAREADRILRAAAKVGYIEWKGEPGDDWDVTDLGYRLLADKLHARLTRRQVDDILAKLLGRARSINADTGRLARITELRLFGSALYGDRPDYGDVDIDVVTAIRRHPEEEVLAVRQEMRSQVPESWRTYWHPGSTPKAPEEGWDLQRAQTEISRGIKGLSSGKGAIDRLGCQYQVIYRFDPERGMELEPDAKITPRTEPEPPSAAEAPVYPVPEVTVHAPPDLLSPRERMAFEEHSYRALDVENVARHEAQAWTRHEGGECGQPAFLRRTAGAHHLFPDWKDESLPGLELLQRAIDWSEPGELPCREGRGLRLISSRQSRVGRFEALEAQWVAGRVTADLYSPIYGLAPEVPLSPRMIAIRYAIAVAMGRMLKELDLYGDADFGMTIDMEATATRPYASLPSLRKDIKKLYAAIRELQPDQESLKKAEQYARSSREGLLILGRLCSVKLVPASQGVKGGFATKLSCEWGRGPKMRAAPMKEDSDLLAAGERLSQALATMADGLPGVQEVRLSYGHWDRIEFD